jgi:plasmid stability protein
MNTTIELPDALFKEIKVRAVSEGRKLDDLVEELLRMGLDSSKTAAQETKSRIAKNPISGLPLLVGGSIPNPGEKLTPERIDEILLEQKVQRHHEAGRSLIVARVLAAELDC